jgi:hypothetical protein
MNFNCVFRSAQLALFSTLTVEVAAWAVAGVLGFRPLALASCTDNSTPGLSRNKREAFAKIYAPPFSL